jgi:hypothetical protein
MGTPGRAGSPAEQTGAPKSDPFSNLDFGRTPSRAFLGGPVQIERSDTRPTVQSGFYQAFILETA